MENETKHLKQKVAKGIRLLSALLFCVSLVLALGAFSFNDRLDISYTDFWNAVTSGKVSEVTITGNTIDGVYKQPVTAGPNNNPTTYKAFRTTMPPYGDPALLDVLRKNGVVISAQPSASPWYIALAIGIVPWFLIFIFFLLSSRRARGMGGGMAGGAGDNSMFRFGKSKARLYRKSSSKVTFQDVAGSANAKQELSEIIDFLKDPSKYQALGGRLPKGVLLTGPPGTGKTLMAKAVAGEADVPFYSISGSEFVEMFVGVGASRVRDMFNNAKRDAPSIIYIDEIDSIGRVRGAGMGGGHDEREQTLNQILTEMDGFSPQEPVVVMASTNRPDILDPALIRPGRFDRRVVLDLPQKRARKAILEVHARNVPLSSDVDLGRVADRSVGFSGADLMNLVNEAALMAARKGKKFVGSEDFDQARDKILMGVEREDLINDKEREIVAYHEAGHALLAKLLPDVDPLQKVSIIPRAHSLGITEIVPEEDRHNLSRSYLLSRITIMLGGRVVERLVFGDLTTGAGDDLKKATQLARKMVRQWGMSDRLGPVTFRQGEEHQYLGRETTDVRDFSEHTAQIIDEEVQRIVQEMEKRAENLLKPNRAKVDALAQALLEQETLSKEDLDALLGPGLESPPRKLAELRR